MREIPLTRGYVALVDDEDYLRAVALGRWHASVQRNTVYAHRATPKGGGRNKTTMHGFLTGYERTDHINGNGLDNRRANLRPSTRRQNAQNERARGGSSRFKGVTRVAASGRWNARIRAADGRRVHLGLFRDEVDAAQAYDDAARRLHGEFAALNFPLPGERSAQRWARDAVRPLSRRRGAAC